MKKQIGLLLLTMLLFTVTQAQLSATDSLRAKKDSTLRALLHEDSAKIDKEYAAKEKDLANKEKWDKIEAKSVYPLLKGGKNSAVVPVKDPTEIPDPNIDYKLLFEVTANNPDSTIKDINDGLNEVARVINLHIASGVPLKRILPVVVVHGPALHALKNNAAFQKKYKINNPSIQLFEDLRKIGVKFIVCGQAMEFVGVKPEELLPGIKLSLTAKTVLTSYQLKGYVWQPVW